MVVIVMPYSFGYADTLLLDWAIVDAGALLLTTSRHDPELSPPCPRSTRK